MSDLVEFLFPAPAPRSTRAIVRWWEARRLQYNLIVGAAGLVSLTFVGAVGLAAGGLPGGLRALAPVVVFGVLANVCYTLGPAVEVLIEKVWGRKVLPAGPTLYRMGLTFSVGLALLPILLVTLFGLAQLLLSTF